MILYWLTLGIGSAIIVGKPPLRIDTACISILTTVSKTRCKTLSYVSMLFKNYFINPEYVIDKLNVLLEKLEKTFRIYVNDLKLVNKEY